METPHVFVMELIAPCYNSFMKTSHNTILVVEDITHIRELLEVTLRYKGYPVESARNGEEALEKIARKRPALVLTDILMPKLDGFALAQKLRQDPQTRGLPIVFLSATYLAPEDKAFGLQMGAIRFLEKPVDTEELLLTIAEVLTQRLPTLPLPLEERTFQMGYRDRLEDKLRHKTQQIARVERLLEDLPDPQKITFEELLAEIRLQREQIQGELDRVFDILEGWADQK
jgi:CheY-like chemotaxis protein